MSAPKISILSFQRSPNVIKIYIDDKYYEGHCEPGVHDKFLLLLKYSSGKALNYLKRRCKLERVEIVSSVVTGRDAGFD